MKLYIKSRRAMLIGIVLSCAVLLSACLEHGGVPEYKIFYPSGTEIYNSKYPDSPMVIENSELLLEFKVYQGDKGRFSDFSIVDAEGELLFEQSKAHRVLRAEEMDGRIWVSAENWSTSQTWGFIDGWLKEGTLYCIDKENGTLLLEGTTEENEMFLTVRDDRAYFYNRGSDPKSEMLGLKKTPIEYARIHYRSLNDWENPVVVDTFEYGGDPDEYDKDIWIHENEGTKNPLQAIGVEFDKLIRKDVEQGYRARVETFDFTIEDDKITLEIIGIEHIKGDPPILNNEKVFFSREIMLNIENEKDQSLPLRRTV